jgi:carboxyl-terminal processing protease
MKYIIILAGGLLFSVSGLLAQTDVQGMSPSKLMQAYSSISQMYVEEVNSEKMVEAAIVAMLKDLDPHSVYMSKKEIERANEPLLGNFDGIGVQFQLLNDTINVISPIIGGPSEKLGVMAGDKIVKVNGEEATGPNITNTWVTERLRGPKGSLVKVSIFRQGSRDLLEFNILRDKIPIYSIDATFMLNDETGYIKISRFAATTTQEFQDGLQKLQASQVKNLILDLRGNSGGYLNIAIELADEFLGREKLIVYTEGKSSPKKLFEATAKGGFEHGNLIVLIDEGSASASEIVTGAVQDWDRGIVIGRRSYGKGLVQKPITLPDGSVIRLTTAKYYTPTGRSIQKPYEDGVENYMKEVSSRYSKGEVYHADSIHFPDSLKYRTPNGRIVFGGGGIMPDIFMPLDTSYYSDYYGKLIRQGILSSFSLEYVNSNRKELLARYPDTKAFIKDFQVDKALLSQLSDYASGKDLPPDSEGIERSKKQMSNYLKALIARNLWDTNAYFMVISTEDDDILKALEVINNPREFRKYLVEK